MKKYIDVTDKQACHEKGREDGESFHKDDSRHHIWLDGPGSVMTSGGKEGASCLNWCQNNNVLSVRKFGPKNNNKKTERRESSSKESCNAAGRHEADWLVPTSPPS